MSDKTSGPEEYMDDIGRQLLAFFNADWTLWKEGMAKYSLHKKYTKPADTNRARRYVKVVNLVAELIKQHHVEALTSHDSYIREFAQLLVSNIDPKTLEEKYEYQCCNC